MASGTTELTIANAALGLLGCELVKAPSAFPYVEHIIQDSVEADLVKLYYPVMRDAVTESKIWSFALQRYTHINTFPIKPEFGFNYKYTIPSDMLNAWRVYISWNDSNSLSYNKDWMLEGAYILTNSNPLNLLYVKQLHLDKIGFASPLFVDALAIRLAAELCIPITNNRGLKTDLINEYELRLQKAYEVDGSQGSAETFTSNQLINCRSSGGGYQLGNGVS